MDIYGDCGVLDFNIVKSFMYQFFQVCLLIFFLIYQFDVGQGIVFCYDYCVLY